MGRFVLTVAVLLVACGVGLGQKVRRPAERPKEAKRAEARAKFFEGLKSELPDLLKKAAEEEQPKLPTPEEDKADTPVVRAGKRAIAAEAERYALIQTRIESGSFSGSSQYTQLTDCLFGQYASAVAVWDDPDTLLPYAEAVVLALLVAEEFNASRVEKGVEEPQLLPQLQAARHRAEAVVLKLREKAKKK
jgi:hypothetical protein